MFRTICCDLGLDYLDSARICNRIADTLCDIPWETDRRSACGTIVAAVQASPASPEAQQKALLLMASLIFPERP